MRAVEPEIMVVTAVRFTVREAEDINPKQEDRAVAQMEMVLRQT